MTQFIEQDPKLDSLWRAIILFGRNVASYKFALGKSLIEIAQEGNKSFINLDELAIPFAKHLSEHLKISDKQGTSPSSRFLDACRDFNQGEISEEQLNQQTVQLGFVNVIDAFHVVNQDNIPVRFFEDERKTKNGITITDELFGLLENKQSINLPNEVEARWRLVETAWSIKISPRLLNVQADTGNDILFVENRLSERINVTTCVDGLIGYQKGRCFYCKKEIYIKNVNLFSGEVDHYFPHVLKSISDTFLKLNIDGVWNLVFCAMSWWESSQVVNRSRLSLVPGAALS